MSMEFILHLTILIGIFLVLTLSAHLITGEAGQLSLAQAGFFAVGAYSAAILTQVAPQYFPLGLFIGLVLGGLLGGILGLPAARIGADYLAIATLAAGEIIRSVANVWSLTGASFGIAIPSPEIFGLTLDGKAPYASLVWGVVLLVIGYLIWLRRRRTGLAFNAVREDQTAASAMGYRVPLLKIAAFAMSGAIGALAGSLYAGYMLYIDSRVFSAALAINILVIVVLGGMGSILGVVLGTVIFVLLPEVLSQFASWRDVIYGAALVIVMLVRPRGLIPERRPHVRLETTESKESTPMSTTVPGSRDE